MVSSYFYVFKEKDLRFKNFIILYFAGLILNALSAQFNHGQNLVTTIWYSRASFFIFFYFYLHYQKISLRNLETTIIVLAVVYSLIYLWVKESYPSDVITTKMFVDRGTIRVKFPGNGFQILGYFLLLNRFLLERKIWQIAIILFLFGTLFLAGYRSLAASSILLGGIMYVRLINFSPMNYLILIPILVLFLGLLQIGDNATILDAMINTSEEQKDQGDDYIRFIEMEYFKHIYPKNFSYYIFGGGRPAGNGPYARYMGNLMTGGIYWVDLGIIGYYWVMGLVALLGIIGWSIKAIFTKIGSDKIYLQFYFAYLILVSFTTMEIFNKGMFMVQAIALFMIDMARNQKEGKANNETISIEQ